MMDSGFLRGQSDNLPVVDVFMMTNFFATNTDFISAEIGGTKATRQFCVVEFPEEQDSTGATSMAVISLTWIRYNTNKETVCIWPTYIKNDSNRRKMVIEHIDPDTSRSDICPIIIKYKTDTYQKAVLKMKELEEYSDVQSQSETEGRVRKIRSKSRLYEDFQLSQDSSEDEHFIPAVPKLSKMVPKSRHTDLETFTQLEVNSEKSVTSVSEKSIPSGTNSTDTNEKICECNSDVKNVALLKKMFTCIHSMESDIKFLIRMMQNNSTQNNTQESENKYIENLPAKNSTDLDSFNAALDDDNVFAAVAKTFEVVGGRDVVDGCRRLLTRIISNQLALMYNWSGRNNKKGFSDHQNITKLIIGVLRKNPLCRNATQLEVESVIKKWLRTASDRDGGRNTRRERKVTI